jgi:hypothetical protein
MIPTNGVLIGLGKTALVEYSASPPGSTSVPARTTHFSFGFTSAQDKSKAHGHVSINDKDCILESGVIYCLHTHSYKPALSKISSGDSFEEVSFFRIDTRP